jgi:predicted ATP-dependent serine protease
LQDTLAASVLERLSETRHVYQCNRCGYRGTTLHWQCPACHAWAANRPITGRHLEKPGEAITAGSPENKSEITRLLS